jgi:hypothetical protein
MHPLFKIPVAVHSILLILDVSCAHPMALLSLFYRSSIAHLSLIYRSAGLFVALLLSALLIHLPRALIYRSSIAHLSLIYRSSIALLPVLLIIESRQTRWMAPPDGSAVQALCLAAFRHRDGRLHSSQFAFASAGRCAAALLGQRTVIKIVDFWVQVVLFPLPVTFQIANGQAIAKLDEIDESGPAIRPINQQIRDRPPIYCVPPSLALTERLQPPE